MPLPPVVAVLTANTAGFKAGLAEASGELEAFAATNKSTMAAASNVGGLLIKGVAVGTLAVGAASVKMAGDYQESVTRLKTGAGESEENLGLVSSGMLKMASSVGTSTGALADGMFLVESAGYRGADGLNVLKAAAQGAKLGNSDLKTVADGVTTALTDYQKPAGDAALVTSQLVTAVALGKTTMGDLSGSLSTVLPQASKAGIGLDQVLGAMSTMTAQGVSAQQSAQNLAGTISSLQNPSSVASKAMAQMGLNSIDVAQNLGTKGLTGTMSDLSSAIMAHMGPAGLVLQSSFNESKLAADSAQKMLTQLPPDLQKLAQGYLDGTVTQKEWAAELKTQPALTANLGRQFATTAKQANGFSDQLKSGKGDAATFNAIMSDMTGGQSGLNTALALTGGNLSTFNANVDAVGSASADASGNVKSWGDVQKDFNFKLDQAKAWAEALGVKIGTALIPKLEQGIDLFRQGVDWMGKHKVLMERLGIAVGGLAAFFVLTNIAMGVSNTVKGINAVLTGKETASTVLQVAALGAQKVATLASSAATAVFSGALYGHIAALVADKAQTVVLVAMYAKDWVMAQAASLSGTVANTGAMAAHAIAAGAMRAATMATSVASGVATAAQWLWNAAMDANPIGIVIVAVAALVAGIVWIATKTTWFQDLWGAVWPAIHGAFSAAVDGIKAVADKVWGFLQNMFSWSPLGLVIENWGAIRGAFTAAVEGIKAGADKVWGFLKTAFSWTPLGMIIDNWGAIEGFFKGLPEKIGNALSTVGDFLSAPFRAGFNMVSNLWNKTIGSLDVDLPSFLGGGHIGFPKLPTFANGVQNFVGGLALVGEHGPELANLPRGTNITPAGPTREIMNGRDDSGSQPAYFTDGQVEKLASAIAAAVQGKVASSIKGALR